MKREQKSTRDFEDVSYASELYNRVTTNLTKGKQGQPKLDAEEPASAPTLSDYHPSEEQKK